MSSRWKKQKARVQARLNADLAKCNSASELAEVLKRYADKQAEKMEKRRAATAKWSEKKRKKLALDKAIKHAKMAKADKEIARNYERRPSSKLCGVYPFSIRFALARPLAAWVDDHWRPCKDIKKFGGRKFKAGGR